MFELAALAPIFLVFRTLSGALLLPERLLFYYLGLFEVTLFSLDFEKFLYFAVRGEDEDLLWSLPLWSIITDGSPCRVLVPSATFSKLLGLPYIESLVMSGIELDMTSDSMPFELRN